MKWFLFSGLILLLLCPFKSISQAIDWKEINKYNENGAILITNTSESEKDLSRMLEDYFFLNDSSLIEYIKTFKTPNGFEQDYRKAWYFMTQFTWSACYPLSSRDDYQDALFFINSVGWVFCGVKSQELAQIWSMMGYKSRIWDLQGHIVPEVFVNNRWEMWDPTYHVFYPDSNGIPASVSGLSSSPELIKKPNDPFGLKKTLWMRMAGYSSNLTDLYSSSNDNVILKTFDAKYEKSARLKFSIPADSKILFPVYSGLPLWSNYRGEINRLNDYAELALYLNPGTTGTINLPLLLHGFYCKNSQVNYLNTKIIIGEKEKPYVSIGFNTPSAIEIEKNNEGIWLFFLVNSQLVKRLNNCDLTGSEKNYKGLEVKYIMPATKNRVNVILLYDIQNEIRLDKFRRAFFRWMFRKK